MNLRAENFLFGARKSKFWKYYKINEVRIFEAKCHIFSNELLFHDFEINELCRQPEYSFEIVTRPRFPIFKINLKIDKTYFMTHAVARDSKEISNPDSVGVKYIKKLCENLQRALLATWEVGTRPLV